MEERMYMKTDMTTGCPIRHIVMFLIPLLIGNTFQQFYNMADTLIVGRYLGVDDLAAVGSSGSIIFLITGFAIGLTAGLSIIISQHYGGRDYEGVKRDLAASILISMSVAVIFTIVSVIFSRQLLMFMRTPGNILDGANRYVKVVYGGMCATVMFNLLSNALLAVGDSRMPLVFLSVACIVNILLDILLIAVFGMGVEGAALATVLSQIISVICCIVYIARRVAVFHLNRQSFQFIPRDVKQQIKMGFSMGFQSSIISIGSILVQVALNSLGSIYVASYAVAEKIESLVHIPLMSFGMTMAAYVGQNYGAGNLSRIRKGVRQCLAMSVTFGIVAGTMIFFQGFRLVGIFVPGELQVMENAQIHLKISGEFFFILAVLYVVRYSLQGVGQSVIPTFAGIMELIMRAAAAVFLSGYRGFEGVCWANPLAWLGACVPLCLAYGYTIRKMKKSFKFIGSDVCK